MASPGVQDRGVRLGRARTHVVGLVPSGEDDPVWWTLRRPFRPLSYHAARAMFTRAGESLGANWSLHDLRHTAAYQFQVPQEVVRKILDHDSPSMTAHYARPHDTTVREHWERARKVNASGETVTLSPGEPLGDAAWTGHRLSRATQALPNGYCELPLVRTCPHANA